MLPHIEYTSIFFLVLFCDIAVQYMPEETLKSVQSEGNKLLIIIVTRKIQLIFVVLSPVRLRKYSKLVTLVSQLAKFLFAGAISI